MRDLGRKLDSQDAIAQQSENYASGHRLKVPNVHQPVVKCAVEHLQGAAIPINHHNSNVIDRRGIPAVGRSAEVVDPCVAAGNALCWQRLEGLAIEDPQPAVVGAHQEGIRAEQGCACDCLGGNSRARKGRALDFPIDEPQESALGAVAQVDVVVEPKHLLDRLAAGQDAGGAARAPIDGKPATAPVPLAAHFGQVVRPGLLDRGILRRPECHGLQPPLSIPPKIDPGEPSRDAGVDGPVAVDRERIPGGQGIVVRMPKCVPAGAVADGQLARPECDHLPVREHPDVRWGRIESQRLMFADEKRRSPHLERPQGRGIDAPPLGPDIAAGHGKGHQHSKNARSPADAFIHTTTTKLGS